jgi:PhnB protein
MEKVFSTPPAGYSTVCPFLMVNDIEKELTFIEAIFKTEIKEKLQGSDGIVHHAEVRIGESVIMIGKEREGYPNRGMTYVFVEEVDRVFQQALAVGAKMLMEPADRFYGFREGGFSDPQGNQWWIASCFEEMSTEEMQKRAAAAAGFSTTQENYSTL